MVKEGSKMGKKGQKWPKMAKKGQKGSKIGEKGQKWVKRAKNRAKKGIFRGLPNLTRRLIGRPYFFGETRKN